MNITETVTVTRANTSIQWPGTGLSIDQNDPFEAALANGSVQATVNISEDELTKTRVRSWTDRDAYVATQLYVNANAQSEYIQTLVVSGITQTRTVEFT